MSTVQLPLQGEPEERPRRKEIGLLLPPGNFSWPLSKFQTEFKILENYAAHTPSAETDPFSELPKEMLPGKKKS